MQPMYDKMVNICPLVAACQNSLKTMVLCFSHFKVVRINEINLNSSRISKVLSRVFHLATDQDSQNPDTPNPADKINIQVSRIISWR